MTLIANSERNLRALWKQRPRIKIYRERAARVAPNTRLHNMLFTSGDELLTPEVYRSRFDRALEGALGSDSVIGDELAARAFGFSTTANACTEYEAKTLAGVPLKVVNPQGETLQGTPLSHFQTSAPHLLANAVRSLYIWGRVYLRKRYNSAGFPTGLEWINPTLVRELTDKEQKVIGYDIRDLRSHERVPAKDVIYFQAFDTDPFGVGISKFETAWRALQTEKGIVTHAAAFFLNSAQPDGFLSFDDPLTDDEFDEAKKNWRANFKGARNAHRTAILPGGARWNPIQNAPKDLAMVELKDSEREDISAVFQVDLMLIGLKGTADPLSANSTYSAVEVAHLRNTTLPLLDSVILLALNKQWAHTDFDRRNYYTLTPDTVTMASFEDANLLRSETAINLSGANVLDYGEARDLMGYDARAEYLKRDPTDALAMWQGGTITLNEFLGFTLAEEKMVVGGNVYLINGQLIPATRLNDVAQKNADAVGQPATTGILPSAPTPPTLAPPKITIEDAPPPPDDVEANRATRNMPLELAISFAGNTFIREMRRKLSALLTQYGITARSWVDENDWRVAIAQVDDWTPAAASKLLKQFDLDETRKVDAETGNMVSRGQDVVLQVAGTKFETLVMSMRLDAESAGLILAEGRVYGGDLKLCELNTGDEVVFSDPTAYPLVANNVTLYLGGKEYHRWPLRNAPPAQFRELKNWRKASNDGRKFTPESLAGSPVTPFVRWALEGECEATDVFDCAECMLRGDLPMLTVIDGKALDITDALTERLALRSIATYRRGLRAAVRGFWSAVFDRKEFESAMQTTIRRELTIAWRDGRKRAGVTGDDLEADEILARNDLIDAELEHISGFADAIDTGSQANKGKLEPLFVRAALWLATYDQAANRSFLYSMGKERLEWVWDPAKEHCQDCRRLNGRVYPAHRWLKAMIEPQSSKLACFGKHCGCEFKKTDKPITKGRIPRLRGPK